MERDGERVTWREREGEVIKGSLGVHKDILSKKFSERVFCLIFFRR